MSKRKIIERLKKFYEFLIKALTGIKNYKNKKTESEDEDDVSRWFDEGGR